MILSFATLKINSGYEKKITAGDVKMQRKSMYLCEILCDNLREII